MNILGYNRIIIVGNNGSGKSFLSRELSVITGLPLVHLDLEFWGPNWTQPSKEEWINKQQELVSKEKWIIEGNHTATMELRFEKAELIIFLDVNRIVCLASVMKRLGKKRSDWPQFLEEKMDKEFFKFCGRLWNFSKTNKRAIMGLHNKYANKEFLVIKGRRNLSNLIFKWKPVKNVND